jgi:MOSC domain-containing protein YiiM
VLYRAGDESVVFPSRVTGIFTASAKGMPMVEVTQILAVIGVGLFLDRYATNQGTYSSKGRNNRQITLIHSAAIAEANRLVRKPYLASETRRNLLVEGEIDLVELIGHDFQVGSVRLHGTEECLPCKIPSRLYGKDDFVKAFAGKGGIRAEVLSTGLIHLNDEIIQVSRTLTAIPAGCQESTSGKSIRSEKYEGEMPAHL